MADGALFEHHRSQHGLFYLDGLRQRVIITGCFGHHRSFLLNIRPQVRQIASQAEHFLQRDQFFQDHPANRACGATERLLDEKEAVLVGYGVRVVLVTALGPLNEATEFQCRHSTGEPPRSAGRGPKSLRRYRSRPY